MNIVKIIISAIILGLLAFLNFWLAGIYGLANFIGVVCFYTLLFYAITSIWRKIRGKELPDSGTFIKNFLFSISIFFGTIVCIFGLFTHYANNINPFSVQQHTLSNGDTTIIFQGMSHVGRRDFYKQVQSEIQTAKEKGYVYFYEQVEPGTQENHEKFNTYLGAEFTPNMYENFSKLLGVNYQDNSIFIGLVNNLDFNVDISIDDIIQEYENTENKSPMASEIVNPNELIDTVLTPLTENQLSLLQWVSKAILNSMMANKDYLQNVDGVKNKKLFDIILHKRNKHLVDEIINSEYKKIFITYGELHFDGVLELLKKNDPNWKIITTKKLYPITEKK